jgi:hypothetical protein
MGAWCGRGRFTGAHEVTPSRSHAINTIQADNPPDAKRGG